MTRSVLALLVCCGCCCPAVAQDEKPTKSPKVPKVVLSDQHQKMVKVGVGDAFPEMALPTPQQGDESTPLNSHYGSQATVVAVVGNDGAMAKTLLRDLNIDIREQYVPQGAALQQSPVATVAIVSQLPEEARTELLETTGYKGLLLLDEDGTAFDQLGSDRLPRVYVLDSKGQVAWLDIEYSLSTRRELKQAVAALAKKPAE